MDTQAPLTPPPASPLLQSNLTHASPSFRLRSPSLNSLRLRRVFDLFDGNADGEISVPEFCAALDRLGLGADPSHLAPLVSSHISPGQTGLGYDDFVGLHRTLGDTLLGEAGKEEVVEADLLEAFKVFDEDDDGFISVKELQTVLVKLGLVEGESIDQVEKMIGSVDSNRDGKVDYQEFKSMMKGIVVNGS